MNANDASTPKEKIEPELPATFGDRLVLWMFLVAIVVFGIILLGDLVLGTFR
jgi:hypothetical protein